MSKPKIYVMLAYTHTQADRPVLAEVVANLRADGFDVETGVAETFAVQPETLRVDADLYVLKSHSALWLNLAAVLDAQNARILNSYSSCVATLNKIRTSARLTRNRAWAARSRSRASSARDRWRVVSSPTMTATRSRSARLSHSCGSLIANVCRGWVNR